MTVSVYGIAGGGGGGSIDFTTLVMCLYIIQVNLHSSPKVMAVFVQYQNLYDNLFGLI